MAIGEEFSRDSGGGPGPVQAYRQIAIETPLGPDVLLLTALDGTEALSRAFVYTVEMFTRAPDADIRTLLGQPVTLWLRNVSQEERRPIHGHIRRLTLLNTNLRGYRLWRAEVVPWLWFLTKTIDCRIYQNLTIREIIRAVLDEYDVKHYEFRLHGQYEKLDYRVRYEESAFAFISRLMEHAGIFYWFEHHADRHVLVLADHNGMSGFTQPRQAMIWPRQAVMSLRPDIAEIYELEHDFSFRSGHWALKDFDFEAPAKELHARETTTLSSPLMDRFEVFEYPGGYTTLDDGGRLTRVRMEAEEAGHYQIAGAGSCAGFDPGKRFMLLPDRLAGNARPIHYFLTEVRHSARDLSYFTTSEEPPAYTNHFLCVPAETQYRPERTTPKPVVQGPQTATVTGPSGENIHTDPYGRVKLRFHWDRHGKRDDTSSCWVRVSQHSAGSHWGALSIPHVGQEVVVSFLGGDPDRPMVIGRVHNGTNMPPLNLPADKHKTVIRDQSDNRILMHGRPGKERMSLVSPKNINLVAMRSPAKALSAQVIDGASFDDYQDGNSLTELLNVYNQLAKAQAPPSGTPASPPQTILDGQKTGSNPAGGGNPVANPNNPQGLSDPNIPAGTGFSVTDPTSSDFATNVDINTLSENDINGLSVGNTNAWINKNMNTSVNGDINSEVFGATHTEQHGTVNNLYRATVRDTFDTLHEEETTMHMEWTLLHIEGQALHLEDTIGHIEVHNGFHIERHWPSSFHDSGESNETSVAKTEQYGTQITIGAAITNVVETIHALKAAIFEIVAEGQLSLTAQGGPINLTSGTGINITGTAVWLNGVAVLVG